MDDLKRIQEDILGESSSSDPDRDLTTQLREKVRSQAERLRKLEQYRLICEQRIQDLSPGHSFPIKPEHLGCSSPAISELSSAKKKISRLEAQVQHLSSPLTYSTPELSSDLTEKYQNLIQDKIELEASLRAEILNSEEQRTYIEILKQALEEHKKEKISVKVESNKSVTKKKIEENEEKFEKNSKSLKSLKNENDLNFGNNGKNIKSGNEINECCSRLKHLLEVKDRQLQEMEEEKDTVEKHLKDAAEALQTADEEIQRLEEEKSNLLEYVDQHSNKEHEMEKELSELSQYFEKIKIEFERTKEKLEHETHEKSEILMKFENHSEDLYEKNKKIRELEKNVESLKTSNHEKENIIKTLKDEKLSMEIKIENIQANSSTLSETLKETQIELEEYETRLKESKKSQVHQEELINKQKHEINSLNSRIKSLESELSEIKENFEKLQKTSKNLEKFKENEKKQKEELESTVKRFKFKCESLEQEKIGMFEVEQIKNLNEEKLRQVEMDYAEIHQAYTESQKREIIQNEALNELRKHNTELEKEVEELYRDNQKVSIEFSQKAEKLEESTRKVEKLDRDLKVLESDKKTLEIMIKSEKNQSRLLKEQAITEKSKLEDLNKKLISEQQAHESTLSKLKSLDSELSSTKIKIRSKERELELETHKRCKISEETAILHEKLENCQKDSEKWRQEMVECYKIVAAFAGKYTALGCEHKFIISQGYKEFLIMWKDKISPNSSILASWISNTIDEIENMSRKMSEMQKDLGRNSSEMMKLTLKLEDINNEEIRTKQENLRLRSKLETLIQNW